MAVKLVAHRARHRRAGRSSRTAATRSASAEREAVAAVSELLAIGTSHKTAPLALRERLALLDGARRGAARAS